MTFTANARERMGRYSITENDVIDTMEQPDSELPGNRAGTFRLSKFIAGRTVVVVSNWEKTVAITCHVPDEEWQELHPIERRLSAHATERMSLLELTTGDIDMIIDGAERTEFDTGGSIRHHMVLRGRYLIVVTDPTRSEIITVFPKNTIWSETDVDTRGLQRSYDEIIGTLRSQLQIAQNALREERSRTQELQARLNEFETWLSRAPEAAE